ncbi:MAG: cation transporter, partial [Bacteroidota bacterium]
LEGENHVFTTHIKLKNIENLDNIIQLKNQVRELLNEYGFEHYTVETELYNEHCKLDEKVIV